jgi:hypothetical protein
MAAWTGEGMQASLLGDGEPKPCYPGRAFVNHEFDAAQNQAPLRSKLLDRSCAATQRTNGMSIFVPARYAGYAAGNVAVRFFSSTVAE